MSARRAVLFAVLLALLILPTRLSGLWRDFPFVFDGDGEKFCTAATNAARDLDPKWYTFPASTYVYPLAAIYKVESLVYFPDFAAFEKKSLEDPQYRWVPARALSGVLSVLVIPATAVLALELGAPPAAALFASALVSVSAGHWNLAHLVRSDMLLVFFCTLAAAFAVRAVRGGTRAAVVSGACAGLAAASKWPGLLSFICVLAAIALSPAATAPPPGRRRLAGAALVLLGVALFAHFWGWQYVWKDLPGFEKVPPHFRDGGVFLRKNMLMLGSGLALVGALFLSGLRAVAPLVQVAFDRRTWLSAAALALAFAVTGPYVLIGGDRLVQGLVYEARSQSLTERGQPGLRNLAAYITGPLSADLGPVTLAAAALGLAWRARDAGRAALPALAFLAVWLGLYTMSNIRSVRYVAPLIPAVAVGAADLAFRGVARGGPTRLAALALMAGCFVPPALGILHEQDELQLPSTRALASDWFEKNAPVGRSVTIEEHSLQLCAHCYKIATPGALYVTDVRTDLAVTSSLVQGYFRADPVRFASELARYEAVLAKYQPIVRFHPAPGVARGPEIIIHARR